MISITNNYVLKYQLDFAPQYKWTKENKCFNTQTGREIRKILNGRCIGYCICGKFYSVNTLRKHIIKVPKDTCPF